MSLFLYSGLVVPQESNQFGQQLEAADQIKTSDAKKFSTLLLAIKPKFENLSKKHQNYFIFLSGYENWLKGNLKKAINQFKDVVRNTKDIELHYRAILALVNLYSLEKNWLRGFELLEKISDEHRNIKNIEVRHLGLIATSIFYNELEQYDMAKIYTARLLGDDVAGRNLCLTLGIKIKAELLTSNIDFLEQEILEAIKTCKEFNEIIPINVLRTYLASYYIEKNNPEKAIELLESYFKEINDTHYQLLIIRASGLLAEAYLKINDLVNARKHALIAISDINSKDLVRVYVSAYEVLATIAVEEDNLNRAYEYQEKYIQVKELLFEQTVAKQLAVESAKHHAVERDNQILLLNNQKKISDLELIAQEQKLLVWSIGFIATAILVFFWFYRRTAQKELLRQKQVNWELQELDKLKDSILANTSHELRTPLNGIIGLSDLIILEYKDTLEDELLQSIRLIGKSGAKLALIVNDILDLAQLKSRRISFNYQKFDVSEIINEVINLCRPLIKTANVTIKFEEENKEISICQDMNRIQQILFNLVGNAVKFTEYGEITINCEQISDFLWFHVRDTGIGIPVDKIDSVFKGFEQVDTSNSRIHGGSGIGLAICKEIVTLLGGEIQLRSELGKGTLVSFYVPVLPPSED